MTHEELWLSWEELLNKAERMASEYGLQPWIGEDALCKVYEELLGDDNLLSEAEGLGFVVKRLRWRLLDIIRRNDRFVELAPKNVPSVEPSVHEELREDGIRRVLATKVRAAFRALSTANRRRAMEVYGRRVADADDPASVTLESVAEELGVSIATVSRARSDLRALLEEMGIDEIWNPPPPHMRAFARKG